MCDKTVTHGSVGIGNDAPFVVELDVRPLKTTDKNNATHPLDSSLNQFQFEIDVVSWRFLNFFSHLFSLRLPVFLSHVEWRYAIAKVKPSR